MSRPDVGHGPSGDRDGRVGMQSVGFVVGTGVLQQKVHRCRRFSVSRLSTQDLLNLNQASFLDAFPANSVSKNADIFSFLLEF